MAVATPARAVHGDGSVAHSPTNIEGCGGMPTTRMSPITAKMDPMSVVADSLVADLDDEQREAVLAPRGPVCVLAGAGTGKTRTITHRIAQLVAAGHVAPSQVLAVTFTQRAAGEMRTRLRNLDAAARPATGV